MITNYVIFCNLLYSFINIQKEKWILLINNYWLRFKCTCPPLLPASAHRPNVCFGKVCLEMPATESFVNLSPFFLNGNCFNVFVLFAYQKNQWFVRYQLKCKPKLHQLNLEFMPNIYFVCFALFKIFPLFWPNFCNLIYSILISVKVVIYGATIRPQNLCPGSTCFTFRNWPFNMSSV